MTTALRLSPTCNLRDVLSSGELVALNVGPDGVVYVAVALKPLDVRTKKRSGASSVKTVPRAPQSYRIAGWLEEDRLFDIVVEEEVFNIHHIQPVGEELLLLCARSQFRGPKDFDRNGRIYNRDGRLVREILLGDGIGTVQATSRGELWVSYFDEGVFGNYGWDDPVGAAGLVAWNGLGEKLYEYDPEGRAGDIADCYALNVESDDDTWCYYYTDFPLVHLHERRVADVWQVPVRGGHAFAVGSGYALFAGGYHKRHSLELLELHPKGAASPIARFEALDEQGNPIEVERTVGRSDSLYLLSHGKLYKITLEQVVGL